MLTKDQRIEPRIVWPETYDRTEASEREPYPGDLKPTRKESFQSIVEEIEHWGGLDVRITTASQHYADRPNVPHQHDKPDDVGVAAYYLKEGEGAENWHAIACDRWETQRENARAIALWARRQRLAERCGVTTAQSTHAASALPSGGEEDAIAVAPGGSTLDEDRAAEILEAREDASEDTIRGAFERRVRKGHADHNGTEDVAKLKKARDVLLDE